MDKHIIIIFISVAIFANAQSNAGSISGASSFCRPSGGGFISLNGYVGNITAWESSIDNEQSWQVTGNTNSTQGYNGLNQTTCYRAIVQDGVNPPDTSDVACVTVYEQSVSGSIVGGGLYCQGVGFLSLVGYTGIILNWLSSTDSINWSVINTTSPSLLYNISETTVYKAVVQNSIYCAIDTSDITGVEISPSEGGTTYIKPSYDTTLQLINSEVFCKIADSGKVAVKDKKGDVVYWIYSDDNGIGWDTIHTTNSIISYSNIFKNRIYKAAVKLFSCDVDYSQSFLFKIDSSFAGIITNNDTSVDYNENKGVLNLKDNRGDVLFWQYSQSVNNWQNIASSHNTVSYEYLNLTDTTKFRVIVSNFNCDNDTSNIVIVNVRPKAVDYVSSVITPNGDGYNDTWYIKGLNNFEDNEVHVYNIFGDEVFYKVNYQNNWDASYNGKILPNGNYFYIVKSKLADFDQKGTITILSDK